MSTDTTKTRIQLINAVALRLRIVGTGQPLEPEYGATIDAAIDPTFAQLSEDHICDIADDDHIPSALFRPLVGLLANALAEEFGRVSNPAIKSFEEANLKRTTASRATGEVIKQDFF